MATTTITVTGIQQATDQFRLLSEGVAEAVRATYVIGSNLRYAHWIEEGFYASGRAGRRKGGGAHMLRAGLATVEGLTAAAVARALPEGARATQDALTGVARQATVAAKAVTPVRSGALRASLHTSTSSGRL